MEGDSVMTGNRPDLPVNSPSVTAFDHRHLKTYLRILDGSEDGADWREIATVVLQLDVVSKPVRARQIYDTYLERARWMSEHGYLSLMKSVNP